MQQELGLYLKQEHGDLGVRERASKMGIPISNSSAKSTSADAEPEPWSADA